MTQKTSQRRAQSITSALFLVGLAILSFTGHWWPYFMLVIGIPVALRQYLAGRRHDMMTTLFVFVGVFITASFDISWRILLPVIFSTAAIYLIFREFLETRAETEPEREDEIKVEIEIESFEHEKKD